MSLYLWLPGLISSHGSSGSSGSSDTQNAVKTAVCHEDLEAERLTFAIKGGEAAARCERSFAYPVGEGGRAAVHRARVCFCVYLCAGKCVQLVDCFFLFFFCCFQRSK